jgi:hypothetical protein
MVVGKGRFCGKNEDHWLKIRVGFKEKLKADFSLRLAALLRAIPLIFLPK